MLGDNLSPSNHYRLSSALRELLVLVFFALLTMVMLYPLSLNLWSMVPEPTDPLLNAWRMQWNAQAFLRGPAGIANLFNTNIFYPFPATLAYSEHFLMETALALPFLLVSASHLFGMNLSVLVTFVLSGYGMYLLVTDWTGSRWAGLVAGALFAFSPQRFGQLNHLELLVTQWLPLTLLALHWVLTRPGLRYVVLFIVFFNLQALSGFHYAFNLVIACALLAIVYTLTARVRWRWGLWAAALLSIGLTWLANWPIWRVYLNFSDVMGAIRTPGEVRIYSAALTDYFTTLPHNLLYGWTFGYWQTPDHQFQPLMPLGVIGLILIVAGLVYWIMDLRLPPQMADISVEPTGATPKGYLFSTVVFLLLLALLALLLSFGLNEAAMGSGFASILKFSPYFWLYDNVAFLRGIRVPGRFSILVVVGLVGLAGWGTAALLRAIRRGRARGGAGAAGPALFLGLTALVLLEAWSAPLVGPEFPSGWDIPAVYRWLRQETGGDTVVLELPSEGATDFAYEYYSSYHWRRMANGGTGFTPPIYRDMRRWFTGFPDSRSVDVIRQLGINLVILHRDAYLPGDWQRILADLPLYLPAFEQIQQVGDSLILRVAKSVCRPDPDALDVSLSRAEALDGLSNAVAVVYDNNGPAAFVNDVRQVSRLLFENRPAKSFTEPLVIPAGETQTVITPLNGNPGTLSEQPAPELAGAWLATLDQTVTVADEPVSAPSDLSLPWQPLGLNFAEGPQLLAYNLSPDNPTACSVLVMGLRWQGGQPGDIAIVQLLDPFGRLVAESRAQPFEAAGENDPDIRTLPLVGSLPPGRYGLRVRVHSAAGQERLPVTEAGVTIPPDQIPPLPVTVHPAPLATMAVDGTTEALFGDRISLLGSQLAETQLGPGDWLRFTLFWQAEQPVERDLTVFTQLLGPDGQVWGQQDHQPKGGWYSTSLWLPGQPMSDDYAFQIQHDAPPGAYRLIAGLYDSDTLERAPVESVGGTGGDFVEIGVIQVEK